MRRVSVFAGLYLIWKVVKKTRVHPLAEVDLDTGKREVDEMEASWPEIQPKNVWQKVSPRPQARGNIARLLALSPQRVLLNSWPGLVLACLKPYPPSHRYTFLRFEWRFHQAASASISRR